MKFWWWTTARPRRWGGCDTVESISPHFQYVYLEQGPALAGARAQ